MIFSAQKESTVLILFIARASYIERAVLFPSVCHLFESSQRACLGIKSMFSE